MKLTKLILKENTEVDKMYDAILRFLSKAESERFKSAYDVFTEYENHIKREMISSTINF